MSYVESSVGKNNAVGGMEIHKSGLRGLTNIDNVKELLTYFQNIDAIMFAQKSKELVIESL